MNRPRRKLRFRAWEEVVADVETLLASGYEHARHGNWSLGQICHHLAMAMEMAVDGFPRSLPKAYQKILRLLFLKPMLRHKPTRIRAPAPKYVQPLDLVDDRQSIDRLKTAIERFRRPDIDYAPHPAFGPMSRDEWLEQQLWHCEHHLSFLLPRADT